MASDASEVVEVREELDGLASAEASSLAELGRASALPARNDYVKRCAPLCAGWNWAPQLTVILLSPRRVAISVVLRWALMRLSSDLQVDQLLSSELGAFSAAASLGAASGLVARHLAQLLSEAAQPREARLAPEQPPFSPELTLTRALGLGILSTASQSAIGASMSALFQTDVRLLADIGQLAAGAAAGAVAGAASGPLDLALRKLERAEGGEEEEGPSPAAVQLIALADGLAFVGLEALCSNMKG